MAVEFQFWEDYRICTSPSQMQIPFDFHDGHLQKSSNLNYDSLKGPSAMLTSKS